MDATQVINLLSYGYSFAKMKKAIIVIKTVIENNVLFSQ